MMMTDAEKTAADAKFLSHCQAHGVIGAEKLLAHARMHPAEFLDAVKGVCEKLKEEVEGVVKTTTGA